MKKISIFVFAVLFLSLLFISIYAVAGSVSNQVDSWWDEDWTKRIEVDIRGGDETLNDFTVLLNVNYDSDMQENFEDLRFVDGSCLGLQTDELAYEFDTVVNLDYALVWVKIPELNTGTNKICMYYGNSEAENGENPTNAWDDNYLLVFHANDGSGSILKDSIAGNNMTLYGSLAPDWIEGKIGQAINLKNDGQYAIGSNEPMIAGKYLTLELWIYHFNDRNNRHWGKLYDNSGGIQILDNVGGFRYFILEHGSNPIIARGTNSPEQQWNYAAGTTDGSNMKLWENKVNTGSVAFLENIYETSAVWQLGRRYDGWGNAYYDEIRASKVARSGAWIARSYDNVNFDLVVFGEEESVPMFSLEFGKIEGINHYWKIIDFKNSYSEPIVIVKPLTYRGIDPGHARLRDVSNEGFEIKFEEWDYLDGIHNYKEAANYLVVEKGKYEFDSLKIEAGKVYAEHSNVVEVNFQEAFSSVPVVLAQVQSYNGYEAVDVRVSHVSEQGFKVRMQEQESYMNTGSGWHYGHTQETIGWIAFEPGQGSCENIKYEFNGLWGFDHNFKAINFQQAYDTPVFIADIQSYLGPDTSSLRYKYLNDNSVEVMVEEEKSLDDETYHGKEKIGYIVLSSL